jgi:hypothetical protein
LNAEPFVMDLFIALPALPGVMPAPKDVLGGGIGDGLQFDKTFEPVCPVPLGVKTVPVFGPRSLRLAAKATPAERASRHTPRVSEGMGRVFM